jgi:putative sterol carrier protein
MSEALKAAAAALTEKFQGADFDGSVRFEIEDEGVIRIEDGAISTEDAEADVTIAATLDTFRAIFDGKLSPTAAYMTGKMRIDGDMVTAMRLSQVLG